VIAKAWSNGQSPQRASSYGIRINPADRDAHFRRSWRRVTVVLSGFGSKRVVKVNLTPSFWRSCPELRGSGIGFWLLNQGAAPWPMRRPPLFRVQPLDGRRLLVVPFSKSQGVRKRHTDGTLCKEGTHSLPPRFRACCDIFAGHTDTCEYDIRYEWCSRSARWVIGISESAGGGGITIHYCPHCGRKLPTR